MNRLKIDYSIPNDITLIAPSLFDWANTFKPHLICFYEKFLKLGVRLPLHPFIYSILSFSKITPSNLCPNFGNFCSSFSFWAKSLNCLFLLTLQFSSTFIILRMLVTPVTFLTIIEGNLASSTLKCCLGKRSGKKKIMCLVIGCRVILTYFSISGSNQTKIS